jgi:hypothetical protein
LSTQFVWKEEKGCRKPASHLAGWEGWNRPPIVILEGVIRQLQALFRPIGPEIPAGW